MFFSPSSCSCFDEELGRFKQLASVKRYSSQYSFCIVVGGFDEEYIRRWIRIKSISFPVVLCKQQYPFGYKDALIGFYDNKKNEAIAAYILKPSISLLPIFLEHLRKNIQSALRVRR